jgi:hypothetical protein
MKRLILLATTLLLSSNVLSQDRHPFALATSHQTVALCELTHNPDLYHGKTVRVVGVAYSLADNTLVLRSNVTAEGGCEDEDSIAAVRPERSPGTSNPVDAFIKKLSVRTVGQKRVSAEVEIIGKFADGAKDSTNCFGPRFSIEANSIKQLSPAMPLFLE